MSDESKSFVVMFVLTSMVTLPTFIGQWGPLVGWLGICLIFSIGDMKKPPKA